MPEITEERFIDLESRILKQDILLEDLNQVLYSQQKQIDQLESALSGLVKRLRALSEGGNEIGPANEKPPHY